jgi:hypothetical protein
MKRLLAHVNLLPLLTLFWIYNAEALSFHSAPFSWEDAATFVESFKYADLDEMHAMKLEQAKLPIEPWSGYFWPLYGGGLAFRYQDPLLPKGLVWSEYKDYLLSTLGQGPIASLSPAEKYDLLVGDPSFTLTRNQTTLGAKFAKNGKVETWLGFCNGWAAASIMLPRPAHSITVTAADGRTEIEFLPSDIKALGALLWAENNYSYRFAGSPCKKRQFAHDEAGRATDPACLDLNPATWHLAVVNQVGVSKRSLIFDTDPAFEVWNQPVVSYDYRYFKITTGEIAPTPKDARVQLRDFQADPYRRYRASNAVAVVGIEMDIVYNYETFPGAGRTDSSATDDLKTVKYRYDLELDAQNQIVGGEWHSKERPDYIWVPSKDGHPTSNYENGHELFAPWNATGPIPWTWTGIARASSVYAQPLGRIVEALFKRASLMDHDRSSPNSSRNRNDPHEL